MMRYFLLVCFLSSSLFAYNCTTDGDCNYNGICTTSHQCHCDSGYVTTTAGDQCAYEQKKELTALLLQIFLGYLGVGEFYAGNNGIGAGQLILTTGSIVSVGVGTCISVKKSCPGATLVMTGAFGLLATIGWWIADIVRFAKNDVKDGQGYELKPI